MDISILPTISIMIVIFCLLILSAFFSASEIALFSFRKTRLAMLVKKGDKRAVLMNQIMKEPEILLSSILVGNNIMATTISVLATAFAIAFFGEKGILIALFGVTFLLIQFGEIIPKVFASQSWEKLSYAIIRPIRIFIWLFYPVVMFFAFITNVFFGLFRVKIEYKKPFITREELRHMVDLTKEAGHLKDDETLILQNVFKFTDRMVKDVMLPRKQVDIIDVNSSQEDIVKIITDTHHTRLPIYEGSPDNIVGALYTKEYVNVIYYGKLIVLQDLLRSPYFVQEDRKIGGVLRELQKNRVHLAIVKDKQGKFVGIITIEDMLEEIVGEIMDEHD